MWTKSGLFLILVGLVFLASPVSASDKTVVVGVEEQDYLPSYAWIDGAYQGAGADILQAYASDQGYRIVFKPLPIRRLYAEMLKGGVDLKFPDSGEWAKDTKKGYNVVYSNAVLGFIDGVVVKNNNVGRGVSSVRVLGTLSGFTVSPDWRTRIDTGSIELKENSRLDQLLRQVMLDRVDGAFVSIASALYVADKTFSQKGALMFDARLPFQRGNYMVSSVSKPEIVKEFNSWLESHRDVVKSIKTRWGVDVYDRN